MLTERTIRYVAHGMLFVWVAGCSTPPEKISASYVSPLQYNDFSCKQVKSELLRVNRRILDVSGAQQSEADKDAVAMGVGLVLFWPALFFLVGDDKKDELARLKGEYEALDETAIQKQCDVTAEINAATQQREEYKKHKDDGAQWRREAAEKKSAIY